MGLRMSSSLLGPLYRHFVSLEQVTAGTYTVYERARCCRIPHPLSPAATLNIPVPSGTLLGHGHLGRQDWLPWGPWKDEGKCKNPRAAYLSLGKAQLGHSGSHSLCATSAPTVSLKYGVKADN